jgi:hypothetical protein
MSTNLFYEKPGFDRVVRGTYRAHLNRRWRVVHEDVTLHALEEAKYVPRYMTSGSTLLGRNGANTNAPDAKWCELKVGWHTSYQELKFVVVTTARSVRAASVPNDSRGSVLDLLVGAYCWLRESDETYEEIRCTSGKVWFREDIEQTVATARTFELLTALHVGDLDAWRGVRTVQRGPHRDENQYESPNVTDAVIEYLQRKAERVPVL